MITAGIQQYKPSFDKDNISALLSSYAQGNGWYTEYGHTVQFENLIANFLGVKHCNMVNNGTIAISLALLAVGVKPFDKVVVPGLTMIATYNAVKLIGATPVIVDVGADMCLNVNNVINLSDFDEIKAIVHVPLNGRHGDTDMLWKIKKIYPEIKIIEDCAQALGSLDQYKTPLGNRFDISTFSFSMPKIITTGQGGCIVTNDYDTATSVRQLKDFGRLSGGTDEHPVFGINSKFTDIQALVGVSQFRDIHYRIERKKWLYDYYRKTLEREKLSGLSFIETDLDVTTPWFVDIYCDRRDELHDFLLDKGIQTRKMYPPLSSQKSVDSRRVFETAKAFGNHVLWLPCYFDLSEEDLKYICKNIILFFKEQA